MYVEKLPPHDERAEESVIGSLLIDGDAILMVSTLLQPEDFYGERNRWCYEACLSLWDSNEAINPVTVGHRLALVERLEEVGGPSYLGHLVSSVPTSAHVEHYARIVSRSHTLRRLIGAAGEIASLGYDGGTDVDRALSQAEDLLFHIRSGQQTRDFVAIRDVLDQYLEESARLENPLELGNTPIYTAFVDLDQLLGGFQRSDMIVLASGPSVGKSTLALNIARHAAGQGSGVGVFSLEMSREQIGHRFLSSEAEVDLRNVRQRLYGDLAERRIVNAAGTLSELPIFIDDTPLQSIVEIRSKARRLHMERKLDLVIVDYLQLVQGTGRRENRVQEIGEITRSLKGIARDLNVPVMALSQLSRAVEARPSHRPQLSDLRESGSIEQDADVVMFIHREDQRFTREEWERQNPDKEYPRDLADLIVAKHRHGPIDTISLRFNGAMARFEDLPTSRGM
ncbi:replicative DNA helicase [SAR202 cluster bacterium AC-647-N09_OGT_505m]|nr:replicative DNA helicase [SAR202 cluster bacterium AC-647-N09_OGT_505m]